MRVRFAKAVLLISVLGGALGCGSGLLVVPTTTTEPVAVSTTGTTPRQYIAFGDSITCGWQSGNSLSQPPYAVNDPGCRKELAYPYILQSTTGMATADDAIPGDQACDIWVRQIAPQGVSPSGAALPLFSMMIGTNDMNAKGAGPYEVNYIACQQAALTWLAVSADNKSLAAASTMTGGFGLTSPASLGSVASATSAGAVTYAITTYGGPVYLWRTTEDLLSGAASISIDGVFARTFNTQPLTPVATRNGSVESVVVERLAVIPAGQHTVTVTWTSGFVRVIGVGTPPPSGSARPEVVVGSVPLPSATSGYPQWALDALDQYTADTIASVTLLSGDTLDVRYAPNHAYLTGEPTQYTDAVHVSASGAQALAAAFKAKF